MLEAQDKEDRLFRSPRSKPIGQLLLRENFVLESYTNVGREHYLNSRFVVPEHMLYTGRLCPVKNGKMNIQFIANEKNQNRAECG